MKITVIRKCTIESKSVPLGDHIEVEDELGGRLVSAGYAEAGWVETATIPPEFEAADSPLSKRRGRK